MLHGWSGEARSQQPPVVESGRAASSTQSRPAYHVVRSGESLSGIAKRYGVSVGELAGWNAIADPGRIRVGQRLRLSAPETGVAEAAKPAPARAPAAASAARPAGADAAAAAPAAAAGEGGGGRDEELREITGELIALLLESGVITRQKAQALMARAKLGPLPPQVGRSSAPAAGASAPTAGDQAAAAVPRAAAPVAAPAAPEPLEADEMRVTYVPEVVKNQIRDELREEVIAQAKAERWAEPSALPEWLQRFTLYGDLRLRYQANYFGSGNVPAPIYNGLTGSNQTNTTEDQTLFNYRARLGVKARISDTVLADLRLSTGEADNPVATNQDLGNYFNKAFVSIDRAYIGWDPNERWSLLGGRTPNPFFSTDLVWDNDINFDGFSGTWRPRLGADWSGFVTGGAYIVQLAEPSAVTPDPRTKYLLAAQAGTQFGLGGRTQLKLGLAYYDFHNLQGIANPSPGSQVNDWTVPVFKQKGNSLFNINAVSDPANPLYALAAEFGVLDLNASADFTFFDPVVVSVYGNFATNLAFDRAEIRARTGLNLNSDVNAYKLGFTVGKAELAQWLDWQAFFNYRHIAGDAVVDAFNDNNFHLGGTNAKGYEIGASLALHRNLWLRARWYSADEVSGPPLAIDVFQLDLDARF